MEVKTRKLYPDETVHNDCIFYVIIFDCIDIKMFLINSLFK